MMNMDRLGTALAAALCFALGAWLAPGVSVAEECVSGTWGLNFTAELVEVVGPGSSEEAEEQALRWGERISMSEAVFQTETEPRVVLHLRRGE